MIAQSCTKRLEYMVLTGNWMTRVKCHWTHSMLTFVSVHVCAPHPCLMLWCHSLLAAFWSEVFFSLSAQGATAPDSPTHAHSHMWWERGLSTELTWRNQREHLQTEVDFTLASLKTDDVGACFTGCKEQVAPQRLITPQQDLENRVTLLPITRFIICIGLSSCFTNAGWRTKPKLLTWFYALCCKRAKERKNSGNCDVSCICLFSLTWDMHKQSDNPSLSPHANI